MAEFVEVFDILKEVCAENRFCSECPIFDGHDCSWQGGSDSSDIEKKALEWKEKHCVRYPTWNEWMREKFPDSIRPVMPCSFMDIGPGESYICDSNCDACRRKEIPADIAKRLGVEGRKPDG